MDKNKWKCYFKGDFLLIMADDTITVNMMPSCGNCKNQEDYQGYKKYTKTWKNLCTSTTCKSQTPGTLEDNPKGVYEGEITCSKCDSDYCGFCGTEKSGSARFKLIAADEESSDTTDSGASSYNDMILDLIAPLDGSVEYRVEDNKVYVNKIPEAESAILWIKEGVNVVNEGISVHDYNPDTYNKFIIHYAKDKKLVLTDDYLIERFGEKIKDLNGKEELSEVKNNNQENDASNSDESDKVENVKTKNIPIETYEDALKFGKQEFAKSKRDNGHSLECKVIGSNEWKQGKWAYVYLPSFNIDMNMYITKTSHSSSASDEWLVGLTLQDYPPSLSSGESNTQDNENQTTTNTDDLDQDDDSENQG